MTDLLWKKVCEVIAEELANEGMLPDTDADWHVAEVIYKSIRESGFEIVELPEPDDVDELGGDASWDSFPDVVVYPDAGPKVGGRLTTSSDMREAAAAFLAAAKYTETNNV